MDREGFQVAHDVSSYSFAALAKAARPLMQGRQGALLTLSYLGAVRPLPSYNVMGLAKASLEANMRFPRIRPRARGHYGVNAISAGPIRTLAASGVKGLRQMMTKVGEAAPLKRNVNAEEVGNAAAFLCSDLASGITGQIVYVDAGYSIVGMQFNEPSARVPATAPQALSGTLRDRDVAPRAYRDVFTAFPESVEAQFRDDAAGSVTTRRLLRTWVQDLVGHAHRSLRCHVFGVSGKVVHAGLVRKLTEPLVALLGRQGLGMAGLDPGKTSTAPSPLASADALARHGVLRQASAR